MVSKMPETLFGPFCMGDGKSLLLPLSVPFLVLSLGHFFKNLFIYLLLLGNLRIEF